MPSQTYKDRGFRGLDTYNAPSEVQPGFLTQCDNLRVDGGDLVTRPGLQGVLTTNHSGPVYGLAPHVKADGTTELLYSAGSKLWRWTPGMSAATEVKLGTASFWSVPGSICTAWTAWAVCSAWTAAGTARRWWD